MTKKITIPTIVKNYWQQYGPLSEVVDRLLSEVDLLTLPAMDLGSYDSTSVVHLSIYNEDYIAMEEVLGSHSNRTSLGRLLTYLFNTSYAENNNWQVVHPDKTYRRSLYGLAIRTLAKLSYIKDTNISRKLLDEVTTITKILEEELCAMS